jgi:hypothetical protein
MASGREIVFDNTQTYNVTQKLDGEYAPFWRQEIARGENATTVLNGEEFTLYSKPYFYEEHYPYLHTVPEVPPPDPDTIPAYGMCRGHLLPVTFPSKGSASSLDSTLADNNAKAELVKKIRRHQTSFQGAVFAGELRETIQLIRKPVLAYRKLHQEYLNSLKKKSRTLKKLPKKALRSAIADHWLEYSFGIVPLYNDIQDGVKTIAESRILTDVKWKYVRAFSTVQSRYQPYSVRSTNPDNPHLDAHLYSKDTVLVKYFGSVDIGSYSGWNPRRVGFDYSNWLPAIWELIPYSFLIDYFTNLGEIVSAASLAHSSVRFLSRMERKEASIVVDHWDYNPGDTTAAPLSIAPGQVRWASKYVTRGPYTGSLVPNLTFDVPGIGTKWLNITALLRNSKSVSRLLAKKA